MMEEINKMLAKSVIEFVEDAKYSICSHNIPMKDLRIAFPKHLDRHFMEGYYLLYKFLPLTPELEAIQGIKVHSTWENAITVYYIHCTRFASGDIPTLKMSFATECEEYGLSEKIVISLAHIYKYKV